ncbi:MAG TPA: preprotein translocase subunit SecE [Microlunatus sp.]|nr:preprotein translocase subunit SecE [Microlunatus sp.]
MATDEERDRVEETPSVDSTADGVHDDTTPGDVIDASGAVDSTLPEPVDADSLDNDNDNGNGNVDDELEIDDPAALERATERVSDAELSEDDELVEEPTNTELAALTRPHDHTPDDDGSDEDRADDDRELVGVGAVKAKTTKQAAKKKGKPTPKRDGAPVAKRTGPVTFVKESVGELRKVVYPTGPQLLNYFVVVLIFVLFVIAFVSVLDLAFGWAILKVFS